MREFRKKQKRLYNIMRAVVIASAVYIFVYIGVQPYIAEFNNILDTVLRYLADGAVIAVLATVFVYYSKYSKTDSFLNYIEHELDDNGYYFTSREEKTCDSYCAAVLEDMKSCGYAIDGKCEIDEFDFEFVAHKGNSFLYCVNVSSLDKNDIIAYTDVVLNDLTAHKLKRKADAVLCFITDSAQKSALALSKNITTLGKKEQIKIANAIVNTELGTVYFLGNMNTKCRSIIAEHILNCELPLKDKYISSEKTDVQRELEEHMKSFTPEGFNNGTFFAH
ncbi:MAG: hypothetical protein J5964_04205 [Eubacterium sp.]|nr:hypothetical protein [Eubacterium sp.]